MEPKDLCIVMPAYNEAECIRSVASGWCDVVEKHNGILVVVNDGSRDRTGEILDELAKERRSLVVIHKPNGGHGDALYVGYREAIARQPNWVFQVDSDDQFLGSDFEVIWEKRHSSNFILGRRAVRHDPFHRLIITRILKFINLLLFGRYIPDVNIPFRLIRGSYLRDLMDRIPPGMFAPNIFLAVLASRDGERLFSIPITHKERETGAVSIIRLKLLKVCVRTAFELWRFRKHL
jgi:dolichol-phosphate mannosyltransferase